MNYIRLTCINCENIECDQARKYVPYDSTEGCKIGIPEDLYIQYFHLKEEVLPFLSQRTRKYQYQLYNEYLDLMDQIYSYTKIKYAANV